MQFSGLVSIIVGNRRELVTEKTIFFAYQGRYDGKCDDNVESIQHAIKKLNQHQKTYKAESWEEYRKTTAISIDILNAIDKCEIFVCDLTYFNHNVLFELGFAIGKNKKILILLNKNINNAADTYRNSFLKDIRYTSLTNANDITSAIQKKGYEDGLIQKYINIENLEKGSLDLLYLKSKVKH